MGVESEPGKEGSQGETQLTIHLWTQRGLEFSNSGLSNEETAVNCTFLFSSWLPIFLSLTPSTSFEWIVLSSFYKCLPYFKYISIKKKKLQEYYVKEQNSKSSTVSPP